MREEACSLLVLVAVAAVGLAYALRATRRGRARFARTDREQGSPFLSRKLLEMGYWALQPLGSACIALGFTANAITWMSLGFGVAAAMAIGLGKFGLGAILALTSNLCDALDGLVARRTGTSSDAGEVLDASIDRWNDFLVLAGVAFFYRSRARGPRARHARHRGFVHGELRHGQSRSTAGRGALGGDAPAGAFGVSRRRPRLHAALADVPRDGVHAAKSACRWCLRSASSPSWRTSPRCVGSQPSPRRCARGLRRSRSHRSSAPHAITSSTTISITQDEDEAHVSIPSKAPPSLDGAE